MSILDIFKHVDVRYDWNYIELYEFRNNIEIIELLLKIIIEFRNYIQKLLNSEIILKHVDVRYIATCWC